MTNSNSHIVLVEGNPGTNSANKKQAWLVGSPDPSNAEALVKNQPGVLPDASFLVVPLTQRGEDVFFVKPNDVIQWQ